jgi:hypothetical protein
LLGGVATHTYFIIITPQMGVHIKGINMLPSFLLQSMITIVIINITITATSPPITPTYGPLDEDSVFAEKKRKNLTHVPRLM